jgi:hypothetical protein
VLPTSFDPHVEHAPREEDERAIALSLYTERDFFCVLRGLLALGVITWTD